MKLEKPRIKVAYSLFKPVWQCEGMGRIFRGGWTMEQAYNGWRRMIFGVKRPPIHDLIVKEIMRKRAS